MPVLSRGESCERCQESVLMRDRPAHQSLHTRRLLLVWEIFETYGGEKHFYGESGWSGVWRLSSSVSTPVSATRPIPTYFKRELTFTFSDVLRSGNMDP